MNHANLTPLKTTIGGLPTGEDVKLFGVTGKGVTRFAVDAAQQQRARGGLVVDVVAYRSNSAKGLGPYEYELARRYDLKLEGAFPRDVCRRKSILIISD